MRNLFIILLTLCFCVPVQAKPNWQQWVTDLKNEAMDDGIDSYLFDQLFADITGPNRSVLHFDKTQPEKRLTFEQYRTTRVNSYKITLGQQEFKKHQELLTKIGQDFGVDPCFIVSLWGMESSYGRFMGNFPVVKSLATLAYDSKRSDFFREQLIDALHILNEGHITLDKFKGEWAGASGQPQFLPSSWRKYAIDYDGDGRKDIWTAYPDIFASIANYLKQNGWHTDEPWAIEVTLPEGFEEAQAHKTIEKTVAEWEKMGIQPVDAANWPNNKNITASIVTTDGGPAFMAFKNFRVIMRYNNSTYYAGSIGYMADKICRRR